MCCGRAGEITGDAWQRSLRVSRLPLTSGEAADEKHSENSLGQNTLSEGLGQLVGRSDLDGVQVGHGAHCRPARCVVWRATVGRTALRAPGLFAEPHCARLLRSAAACEFTGASPLPAPSLPLVDSVAVAHVSQKAVDGIVPILSYRHPALVHCVDAPPSGLRIDCAHNARSALGHSGADFVRRKASSLRLPCVWSLRPGATGVGIASLAFLAGPAGRHRAAGLHQAAAIQAAVLRHVLRAWRHPAETAATHFVCVALSLRSPGSMLDPVWAASCREDGGLPVRQAFTPVQYQVKRYRPPFLRPGGLLSRQDAEILS